MEILLIYLVLINAVSFGLMRTDKKKAVWGQWRIPERVLLGFAAAGGSVGTLLGMKLFRHKTLHKRFSVGIPVMIIVHSLLLISYITHCL